MNKVILLLTAFLLFLFIFLFFVGHMAKELTSSSLISDMREHKKTDYDQSTRVILGRQAESGQDLFKKTFLDPFRQIIKPFLGDSAKEKNNTQKVKNAANGQNQGRMLSEKEIFDLVWPPSYIKYLRDLEEIMRKDQYISQNEQYSFVSDSEIYAFLSKFIDYLMSKSIISAEQSTNFKNGVTVELSPLIEKEKAFFRGGSLQEQTTGGLIHSSIQNEKTVSFSKLIENIHMILGFSAVADAQVSIGGLASCLIGILPDIGGVIPIGGGFFVSPGGDCYKDFNPFYLICGFNSWAPCCDCFVGHPPKPVGCLNAVCAAWPNAIWDPTTGICGCG